MVDFASADRGRRQDTEARPIRVVIGERNVIEREGTRSLLAADPAIEVCAAVGDLESLREACKRERPDVVDTGIAMPPTDTDEGIRLCSELRELAPEVGVVVLTRFAEPRHAFALLERGSAHRAFLLKHRLRNRAELTAAIRAVADGASVIDPMIVERLVTARRQLNGTLRELTAREREVLEQIAEAKSNQAIASSLFLTKRAVEKHVNAIFLKLGLTDSQDTSKRVTAVLMLLQERAILGAPAAGDGGRRDARPRPLASVSRDDCEIAA